MREQNRKETGAKHALNKPENDAKNIITSKKRLQSLLQRHKKTTPRERRKSVKPFIDSSLRAKSRTLYLPRMQREGRQFEEVQAQKEHEERLIWQSATRIANEFGLDPVAVRNSMASPGVVDDNQENKIDKDSANAN